MNVPDYARSDRFLRPLSRSLCAALLLGFAIGPCSALAQEPPPPATPPGGTATRPGGGSAGGGGSTDTTSVPGATGGSTTPPPPVVPGNEGDRQRPPELAGAKKVNIDTAGTTLRDLVKYFADLTGRNFILPDDGSLKESVIIISHKQVSVGEAYEAFLQALELNGYTTVQIGSLTRIVKSGEAAQSPTIVHTGDTISSTANYVTQIIPLENVSVSDVQSVVQSLASPEAKIVAYNPTNTFIITEMSVNLKRIFDILTELDVAAPRSRLEIIPVQYAKAEDIKQIIEELYGTASSSSTAAPAQGAGARRRPRADAAAPPEPAGGDSVSAGKESKYIDKVLADERTNSLIVIANDEGQKAVLDLLAEIDVDVDPSNRSQIHVVYLEHAKAEEVATVLSNLSESGGQSTTTPRRATTGTTGRGTVTAPGVGDPAGGTTGSSVTAAFDGGMRITQDESTNALVIIANSDDYAVIKQVIDKLDVQRRQVLIDAVILELTSDDSFEAGVAYHGPFRPGSQVGGIIGGQFGTNSLGLSQDLLSGLAMGVFGPTVNVPFNSGSGVTNVAVPAFGIVLQALRTNSSVDIVSNPQLLTLDNEEAKIVVGRKVPFPTSTSFSQLGTPIVSYQREDVATTLKVTPRVNSSNQVTLEVTVEVAEVEEDSHGLDPSQAGFITSKREIDTTALVWDNQTVVLGGLVGTTDTKVETKVPILGDLPVIGMLFRGSRTDYRKSNLMIFLTPHIVDDEDDMLEIMKIKEAQRQEFIRRFYGKSREAQMQELQDLLKYSMNFYGEVPMYSGPDPSPRVDDVIGGDAPTSDTPASGTPSPDLP